MLNFMSWQRWIAGILVISAVILSLPNILPQNWLDRLPRWVTGTAIEFAIDLRGGSRLVVQSEKPELDAMMAVMGRRLEMAGSDFAHYRLTRQGGDQIRVEVPSLFDVSLLKSFVTVSAQLSLHSPLSGMEADDVLSQRAILPHNALIFYDHSGDPPIGYLVDATPLISADSIKEAVVVDDKTTYGAAERRALVLIPNQPIDGLPHADLIAVMDGEVIGLATLNDQGGFTLNNLAPDFAENLKIVLNAGALPAPARILEERTIGSDMGGDFAAAGLHAVLGALIVVSLFMIVCYGILGLIANITLAINLALVASILGGIGWPLSLAGFAGLILTIGVSVDALILIFERIREEWRGGADLKTALEAGFDRAQSTILDANMTTLLGAIMLFLFGDGPISGFAMTVTIGICAALFTNLVCARLVLQAWLIYFKPRRLPMRLLRLVPTYTAIAFMRMRTFCLFLAVLTTCLTFTLFGFVGLHYGIDFAGGSLAVLQPHEGQADMDDIALRARELNIGAVRVTGAEQANQVYLTIPSQKMGEEADQSVALKLRGEFDADYQLERVDVVGAQLAAHASHVSLWAVFLSLAAIFFYVWARFNWKFGLGALIATLHDIIVILLIFALMQWEFNLWSIAALLAIIGYSLNDTIVVYDRIRGLLKQAQPLNRAFLEKAIDGTNQSKNRSKVEVIDLGINRTLSRTILTSLATLLAHIPLYYYGGADMRNFASVLLIGILVGTASSIFIAGPLLAIFGVKTGK